MFVPKIRRSSRCIWIFALAVSLVPAVTSLAVADDRATALRYLGQGADAYRMGDLTEATRHWSEAIRFCRIAGDPALEAEARARRGEALESLGQFRAAADDLTTGLAEAEKVGNSAQIASLAGALGNLYFQTKQFEKARALLDKSLEL